ncbi:MAG: hypothetical protein J5965_01625 [Aeriscardovia sp.]|nr:hypothetical protein [Aeriscardovia sp.]
MSNKIKEIIIIFWGGIIICLSVANTFGWIDVCQWLQQVSSHHYTYEQVAKIAVPAILVPLVLLEIAKIIRVSFEMGRTPSLSPAGSHQIKLLPALPVDNVVQFAYPQDSGNELDGTRESTTTENKLNQIRERHQQEQNVRHQQVMNAIHDYLYNVLAPYMKGEDIDTLFQNIELWQYSADVSLCPTMTNGKLTTLDLRHLVWNVGERLKWSGEQRAIFAKQSFPHEFQDSDISSIRRNLRQQGDCIIKIDIPGKHDFTFHMGDQNE